LTRTFWTMFWKRFWRTVWKMAGRMYWQSAVFQACSACSACHFSKWAQNLQKSEKLWGLSTFNHGASLIDHQQKFSPLQARSLCGVPQDQCAQGAGSNAKNRTRTNRYAGRWRITFFGKLCGRTFGVQSLREVGRLLCEYPWVKGGRCRRCCCRACR
jgi:hypothetical protein